MNVWCAQQALDLQAYQQAYCNARSSPSETHSKWHETLRASYLLTALWQHSYSTLKFPGVSSSTSNTRIQHTCTYQNRSYLPHVKILEHQMARTGKHVTNMDCGLNQTWAWFQTASLYSKLLHCPGPHMRRIILFPSEVVSFHSIIIFWRELNLNTSEFSPQ